MGISAVAIFLLAIAALALVVFGAFWPKRSLGIVTVSTIVMLLALLGAWYALVESQSMPWAMGYGTLALLSLGVGIKNLALAPKPPKMHG